MMARDEDDDFSSINDAPVFVEIHDARVDERIEVHMDGAVVMPFTHLATYHQIGPERYAVVSRKATLILSQCHEIRVVGILTEQDTIVEGHVFDSDNELDLGDCLGGHAVTAIFFIFGSGAKIALLPKYAQLVLSDPQRRLSDWIGPLVST